MGRFSSREEYVGEGLSPFLSLSVVLIRPSEPGHKMYSIKSSAPADVA